MSAGATQSDIAEGGLMVNASQTNIEQKVFNSSSYVYNQLQPNTYGQALVINNSNTQTTINIPSEVFDLGASYLEYTVNIPAPTAGYYIWTYADTFAEIQHIQYFSSSNQLMIDLDYISNYLKVVSKKETSLSDYKSFDPLNRLSPSNSLVNQVPALRHSGVNGGSATPSPSSSNYDEPAYFNVGALGQGVSYNVQLPLKMIKNTILELEKDFFMPGISYLKIYFSPIQKVCYMSTTNVSPSSPSNIAYAPLVPGSNVTIGPGGANTNGAPLSLYLAVETAKTAREMAVNRVMSGGLKMFIPYTMCYKNANNGPVQSINVPIDSGQGMSIRKVIHTIYNNNEALDTAYDCSNISGSVTNPPKCTNFYTSYNSSRIQNVNIDLTTTSAVFLDYLLQKRALRGSVLQNYNIYGYNWFWCDDFCSFGPEYDQNSNNELIGGLPIGPTQAVWTFYGLNMAASPNNSYQHYTYITYTKELMISPTIVEVKP